MAASPFLIKTLKNGLTLIGEPNPANKSCGLGYFVKTGSRDETKREAGVSHFLEHMMFKGTKKRSALDITFELGNIGAQANAYTSEENTVYYAVVLPEYFSTMQELLSDMLRPALDPEEFRTEKKVILEEIALYQDRPHFFLFEKAMSDYFGTHPAGNSVLGTTASIGAVERDEMKAYFDRRYSPSNMALVATGNFSWDAFVEDAERYCGAWKNFPAERPVADHTPKPLTLTYTRKNLSQAHVVFVTRGASAQADERYPLALLSLIIGDSSGSRMYWDLVDPGLAESAGADSDEKDGTGCFMASASMEPERVDEVAARMRQILSTPLNFSEADLERVKTKLNTKIVLSGELPIGRLMALGTEWNYRQKLETLKEVVENVRAVTKPQIEAALSRFDFNTWAEFRLMPE